VAEPRSRLEDGLAGRYVLERELGRGGMATVFLAHDPFTTRASVRVDPFWASLRDNPKFQRLITR